MQIFSFIWLALGLLGAIGSATICRIPNNQPEKKLLRLWLASRAFLIALGISFLVGIGFGNVAERTAFGVVGATCTVLGAVTTARCRSAFCIMVATLGLGSDPRAMSAAKLVFMDLEKPFRDGQVRHEAEMGAVRTPSA